MTGNGRRGQRVLAIDYGQRRIGLALCDALGITAEPRGWVARSSDAQAARIVAGVARAEGVQCIVLGLPLHAHGDEGDAVAAMRRFRTALAKAIALPIHELDERYSSEEAEAELREAGRWPAETGAVDALAAAIILRRWLAGEDA